MNRSERLLSLLLRLIAAVEFLALVAVFMPHAWMDACHRGLGLGTLPALPVIAYLTRSLSLLYALQSGLLLALATDVRRYRPLIVYVGFAFVAFGSVVSWIDVMAGLPWIWMLGEGPLLVTMGVILLTLLRGVRAEAA